jgi:lauroyl/myristoyl acyltransferase
LDSIFDFNIHSTAENSNSLERDAVSAYAYLIGWRVVRFLPEKFAYKLFYAIGDYVYRRNGKSIKRLKGNLQRVTKFDGVELDNLTKDAMRSYMRYWCDTFRFPDWSKSRIFDRVELVDSHFLTDPLDQGKGVVVALPHAGNWDHAAAYFLGRGYKAVTVAERLKPERLFQAFLKYRQDIGLEILSTDMRTVPTLIDRAKNGFIIALVADRDLSSNGVEVDFFGGTAKMPAGPSLIAERAEVDLVGAFISYTSSGIKIKFSKLEKNVQAQANFFATEIAKRPVDWHMLQRIWI